VEQKVLLFGLSQELKLLLTVMAFFNRLVKWFARNFSNTSYEAPIGSEFSRSTVHIKHPIRDHIFRANLAVIRFNLNSQNGAKDEA
jgi:hypothetical protein